MSVVNVLSDGIDHINIYFKGATELGRMLSNFARFPIETEDGNFMSVEGYWYYLSIDEKEPQREELREVYGFNAKKLGKKILQETNGGKSSRFDDDFENKILKAIRYKFERNLHLITPELKNLPFEHYYNFGGKIVDVKEKYYWIINGITQMRNELTSNTTLVKCRYCGETPLVIDVGGNNPHYEISCTCDKGLLVDSSTKEEAISSWNILNERVVNNG